MPTFTLGQAAYVNKGAYSAGVTYVALNTVFYNGGTWVALGTVSGVAPGSDSSKWLCISQGLRSFTVAAGATGYINVSWVLTDGTTGSVSVPTDGVPDNAVTEGKIANGAVTYTKLASDAVRIRATDQTVAVSAWSQTNSSENFPWRASVGITGVTADMRPEVCFGVTDLDSGIFAPFAQSYAGGVYIYAAERPGAAVTIPVIDCMR